jgi:hypothetical protein
MTKEQFLNGTPFYIKGKKYAGDSTFTYNEDIGCICKQSRSSLDERMILDDYECNMGKLGRIGFTGFTHVMGKRVIVKLKFSDLIPYESEVPVGE